MDTPNFLDAVTPVGRPLPLEELQEIVASGVVNGLSRETQIACANAMLADVTNDPDVSVDDINKALRLYRALLACITITYDNIN